MKIKQMWQIQGTKFLALSDDGTFYVIEAHECLYAEDNKSRTVHAHELKLVIN